MTGTLIDDWRTVVSNINAPTYTDNWQISNLTWQLLPEGTSYVSVRVFDEAGNSSTTVDAFFILKDTHCVVISDNQDGDFTWRNSSGTLYDIDYIDTGGSKIKYAQYRIVSGTGAVIVDWYTYASNISSDSYTTDFSLPSSHFDMLPSSFSYVTVRVFDYALNLSLIHI